jgi:hypothetical protein
MAEYIAAEKLGLRLAPARTAGHDAVRKNRDGSEVKIQIKGWACGKKPKRGLRMGRIKRGADCESVVLVLLDDVTLDPHGMWEAPYAAVEARQLELRTEKGLRVTDFKNIAKLVWPTAAEKGPADARSAHVAP